MNKLLITLLLFSLTFIYACPQTETYEEEVVVEKKKYDFEVYEEDEIEEEEVKVGDDPTHLENPADVAGSLIF